MKWSFLFLFFFIALGTSAQFNDSVFHYIRFSTTGILNNTNERKSFVLTNSFAYTLEKNKISLSSNHTYVYGRQGGDIVNNDYTTSLNMDILKNTHKIYYWGLMNYTTSKSLNIFNQFQGGVGLGWNIVDNERINVVITDGIMYETSQILNTDKLREHYNTWRNSLRIKHAWNITQEISLEGSHFWQPSLEDSHDYIIRSTAALNFQLKRWLRFTTGFTYNKISRTDRENLIVNIGLTASGYF